MTKSLYVFCFIVLTASSNEPGWPGLPGLRDLNTSLDNLKKISSCSHKRVVWLDNWYLRNRAGNFSHANTSAWLLGWIFSTSPPCSFCFSNFASKTSPKDLSDFLVSVSGLKFLVWTQDKILSRKRTSPVIRAHVKRPWVVLLISISLRWYISSSFLILTFTKCEYYFLYSIRWIFYLIFQMWLYWSVYNICHLHQIYHRTCWFLILYIITAKL